MLEREFISATYRDMEGNVALLLASGKTPPTEASPFGKLKVNIPKWFHYPTELDKMVDFAQKNSHRDLYLTPAVYGDEPYRHPKTGIVIPNDKAGQPLYSRSKENTLYTQTIYMDSDSCPPEAFRIPPSRHVDTSDGHGHDWWYLSEPIPASQAAEIAHRITTAHKDDGSDPSGWAANKVLRMPTVNTAYDPENPFEISFWETDAVYNADDISAAYDDIELTPTQTFVPAERVPVPDIEGLPDFLELSSRIPATQRRLNDLLTKEPQLGEQGWRSTQRWALILDCLRFGFTPLETAALVWRAPSGRKWVEDDRGFDGLWWEINEKAVPVVLSERGGGPATTVVTRPEKAKGPKLITPTERANFEERSDTITLYCEYARQKLPIYNAPLHQANAWMLLALAFSSAGAIPKSDDLMPLNFYMIELSESSSGKGEAKAFLDKVAHELYPGDHFDLGGDHSKSALLTDLLERENKMSWLHIDEFDGNLQELKSAGWNSGIQAVWTKVFDGKIPSLGRVGKGELNKAGVRGFVSFHAMGTIEGIMRELDKMMFYTGYLARNIFVFGDDLPVTEESMKIRRGKTNEKARRGMPRYFGSWFNRMRFDIRQNAGLGSMRTEIDITDEAADRFERAKWVMWEHFKKFDDEKIWRTSIRRMWDTIWKMAALEAMSFGRPFIQESDITTALAFAEVWLDNLIIVADGISDTFFSKQCDAIEKFISTKKDSIALMSEISAFRKGEPVRITEEYLKSLTAQRRLVEEGPTPSLPHSYRIPKERR